MNVTSLPPGRYGLAEFLIPALLVAAVSAAIVTTGSPLIVLGILFLLLAGTAIVWRFGGDAPLLAVIVIAPLIPVAEGGRSARSGPMAATSVAL